MIVAFTTLQGLLNYASTYMNDWVTAKVSNDLKRVLYTKMMHKSSVYFDTSTSGDVLWRFHNDADLACGGLLGNVKVLVSRLFSSISLCGVLIYNSWQLSLVAIFMLFLAIVPLAQMRSRILVAASQSEANTSAVITSYNEAFSAAKSLKHIICMSRRSLRSIDSLKMYFPCV